MDKSVVSGRTSTILLNLNFGGEDINKIVVGKCVLKNDGIFVALLRRAALVLRY